MNQNDIKAYVLNVFGTNYEFLTTETKFKKIARKVNLELAKALVVERIEPNILASEQTTEVNATCLDDEIMKK